MKRWLIFILLFAATERFCHWQTRGFSLSKMLLSSSSSPKTPSESLTFLGAGNQFYAFETADHHHVVKFIKFSRRRPLPWLEKLPLPSLFIPWRDRYLAERAKRLTHLEQSAVLALQRIPFETGLLPTPPPHSVTLEDKLGIRHSIHLSQTRYFLQKKAVPFTEYFNQHPLEARPLIDSYIETVTTQCRQGLCNLDPLIERNYGVANHRVIILDIGSFLPHDKRKNPAGLHRQIFLELLPLREWLQRYHPEHLDYFDASFKKNDSLI